MHRFDHIVVAADNLFSEKLTDFGRYCREKQAPILAVYDVGALDEVKKYNAVTMDREGRITHMSTDGRSLWMAQGGKRVLRVDAVTGDVVGSIAVPGATDVAASAAVLVSWKLSSGCAWRSL